MKLKILPKWEFHQITCDFCVSQRALSSGCKLALRCMEPAFMRGVYHQPGLCPSKVISLSNWRFSKVCVPLLLMGWRIISLRERDIQGLLLTGWAWVLQWGDVLGASGSSVVASDIHFQKMELWLSLNSPLFWLAQRKEKKKRLKFQSLFSAA